MKEDLPHAAGTKALALLLLLRHSVYAECNEVDDMLVNANLAGAVVEFAARHYEQCVLRNAAADLMGALLEREKPYKLVRMVEAVAGKISALGELFKKRLESAASLTCPPEEKLDLTSEGGQCLHVWCMNVSCLESLI